VSLAGCVARTQAYTNDPAAGSDIELNMVNTAGFLVGDNVQVSSGAGTETANITVVHVNTHITVDVLALNHTTVNPLVTGVLPYDIWVYNNAGTLALEALAWTDGATRATALALQDSVYVKSGDATRRYVGAILCDMAGGKCTDSVLIRGVNNYYNRVLRSLSVKESTSHVYNGGWRKWNNNDVNNLLRLVIGVAEDAIFTSILVRLNAGADGSVVAALLYANGVWPGYFYVSNNNVQQISAGLWGNVSVALTAGSKALQLWEYGSHAASTLVNGYAMASFFG